MWKNIISVEQKNYSGKVHGVITSYVLIQLLNPFRFDFISSYIFNFRICQKFGSLLPWYLYHLIFNNWEP